MPIIPSRSDAELNNQQPTTNIQRPQLSRPDFVISTLKRQIDSYPWAGFAIRGFIEGDAGFNREWTRIEERDLCQTGALFLPANLRE